MATTQIQKHIVTKGNLGVATAGQPLYVLAGKRIHYNVLAGQLVAYLTTTGSVPITINATSITAANIHRVRLGVGHAPDGVTVEAIRHLGAEEIGNCQVEAMSVASPKCGSPAVKDFFFNCVDCEETYTIAVGVDDNFTRSFAPLQKSYAEYIGSYVPNCKTCDGCDTEVDCNDIVEGLVQSIRQDNPPTLGETRYPDYRHPDLELPFEIMKLQPRSIVYCLGTTNASDECESCTEFEKITYALINGEEVQFTGNSIGDTLFMTRGQIDNVVDQINEGIVTILGEGKGRAYVTGNNASKCCPLQLHVNIEDGGVGVFGLFDDDDGPIPVTSDVDPFDGITETCGIRVIAAPISTECGCYIEKPLAFYGRNVRIQARGDGFVDSREVTIQNMEMPGQFGTLIQYMELYQDRGGSGRQYSAGHQGGTWLGNPRSDSRVVAAPTADCAKDYCSFYIRSRQDFYNQAQPGGSKGSYLIDSYIHVPSGDATTITAVGTILDKWATLSTSCMDTPALVCTPLDASCA